MSSGDENVTVVWEAGDSLPLDIMKMIKNSNVTLEFKYAEK